jgi:hypothetical protein
MKTEHRIITIHFLEILRKKCQDNERLNPIKPSYLKLLQREELIKIIELIYDGEGNQAHPNYQEKSSEELLCIINDEYYILWYMIEEVWGKYTL